MSNDFPLTKEEFNNIYSKVPRLSVETLVRNEKQEVYLTRRAIEPCTEWTVPGGTLYNGETLNDALIRVAQRELSISVSESKFIGYVEYPSHKAKGLGTLVGLVFEITKYSGEPKINSEASDGGWFSKLPDDMHADQDEFLLSHHFLVR